MRVAIRKLSDKRHNVTVIREDGSAATIELDSKDFLRHDLAHFAVEVEVGLEGGYWGSVARGGRLDGVEIDGSDIGLAERIAGPMQTLMRTGAGAGEVLEVLETVAPDIADADLAYRLHQRMRALVGHWAATKYGHEMILVWPIQ